MGFSLTNLPGGKKYRNAHYHDPYLLTIYRELGEPDDVRRPSFTGYEWDPRWLRLATSGAGVRCVPAGYELLAPPDAEHADAFKSAAYALGATVTDDEELRALVKVAKASDDESGPDSEDRIKFGAGLVLVLVGAGL